MQLKPATLQIHNATICRLRLYGGVDRQSKISPEGQVHCFSHASISAATALAFSESLNRYMWMRP